MFAKWLSNHSKNNVLDIGSPMTGTAVPLENVPDEAFAGRHMGNGVAIEPAEGRLIAPFDCTVVHLIHTKHAVILEHESGLQLLMHIGINTVRLKGEGFKALVKAGDQVQAGDSLIEFDIDFIRGAGYPLITPVVIAGGGEKVESLEAAYKDVTAGEPSLLQVVLKP